jgi:hypothetical protein
VLSATFQNDYPKYGTGPYDEQPFAVSLAITLSGAGNGAYMTDGMLGQTGTPAATKTFQSDLVPYLNNIDPVAGLSQATLDKMMNGDLESDKVYQGNLGGGFAAFLEVLKKKLTYNVQADAFKRRILVGTVLKVPGVILVDQNSPLELGPITQVEGGILITRGPIRLKGDIVRGAVTGGSGGTGGPPVGGTSPGGGSGEPLTLVSLSGDITLDAGAKNVDAVLVALNGKVKFSGDVNITGGIAGKTLDLPGLAAPGTRKIKHSEDMDPLGPNKDLLKVYYGGDDHVQVSGSGS